jgi:hypothetical protein
MLSKHACIRFSNVGYVDALRYLELQISLAKCEEDHLWLQEREHAS